LQRSPPTLFAQRRSVRLRLYPALAQTVQLVTGNGRFKLKTVLALWINRSPPQAPKASFCTVSALEKLYPSEILATVTNKTDSHIRETLELLHLLTEIPSQVNKTASSAGPLFCPFSPSNRIESALRLHSALSQTRQFLPCAH
jgi:hypothetical protein